MDIDLTYLFQFGFLLICLVGLNGLILGPILRVLQEREQQIEGAQEQTERLQKAGDHDREIYQEHMRTARRQAQTAREERRAEGRTQEREILERARADIATHLQRSREALESSEAEARKNLSSDTEALAQRLVEKVLGRKLAA